MTIIRRTPAAGNTEARVGTATKRMIAVRQAGAPGISISHAAVVAGVGLLVMAGLSFLSSSGLNSLFVVGNPQRTGQNIAANEQLLRWCVGAFLLVAVLDLIVAWALYIVLRPASHDLALLAAILRVAYAAAFVATLSMLLSASHWVTAGTVGPQQAHTQAFVAADAFNTGWAMTLTIFGVHLLVLGYVVTRAAYIPTLVGVLVMISGLGYFADGLAGTLWKGYHLKISAVTFIGEVALMVWLLWAGRILQAAPTPDVGTGQAATV